MPISMLFVVIPALVSLALPGPVLAAPARLWRFVCLNPAGTEWKFCQFAMYTDTACSSSVYDASQASNPMTEVDFNGQLTQQDPVESQATTVRGPYTAANSYFGVTLSSALEINCVKLNNNICVDSGFSQINTVCTSGYHLNYADGGEWKTHGTFTTHSTYQTAKQFVVGGGAPAPVPSPTPTPSPGAPSPTPTPTPTVGNNAPTWTVTNPDPANPTNVQNTGLVIRVSFNERVTATGGFARLYLANSVVQSESLTNTMSNRVGIGGGVITVIWWTLSSALLPSTQYRFEVNRMDVQDLSGDPPASDITLTFTTAATATTGTGTGTGSTPTAKTPAPTAGGIPATEADDEDDGDGGMIALIVILVFVGLAAVAYLARKLWMARDAQQSRQAERPYGKVVTPAGTFQEESTAKNKYRKGETNATIPPEDPVDDLINGGAKQERATYRDKESFEELRKRREKEFEERRAKEHARKVQENEEKKQKRTTQDDSSADRGRQRMNAEKNRRSSSAEEQGGPKFNANAWNAKGARKAYGRKRSNSETIDPDTEFLAEANEGEEVLRITTSIAQDFRRQKTEAMDSRKKTMKFLKLKWHPDKNSDQPELAKKIFQFIMEQEEKFLALGAENAKQGTDA
ncbi:unnamed protein product [Amoebophrya sp. A120]|nr:unnamed protein product [Amoebophrya sp. A120]|eukprot:GSA120T00020173001.1